MSLVPYLPSNVAGASATLNVCPSKAATTTTTNMGTVGYMISGEALFNPYEGDGEPPTRRDQSPALPTRSPNAGGGGVRSASVRKFTSCRPCMRSTVRA
jgi:hypothetical protein